MKYRTKYEIICDTLEKITEPKTRTKIMYEGYLSYTQLKEYMVIMMAAGLIQKFAESDQFVITKKGIIYIERFKELNSLLS